MIGRGKWVTRIFSRRASLEESLITIANDARAILKFLIAGIERRTDTSAFIIFALRFEFVDLTKKSKTEEKKRKGIA